MDNNVANVRAICNQFVVDAAFEGTGIDSQARACGTLRVKIDDQDLASVFGQRRREVDCGSGFTHAALLIGHSDNPGRTVRGERRRLGEILLWCFGKKGFLFSHSSRLPKSSAFDG